MLPRLVWRLEAQLRGNLNRPDFLYEATRVYLMLGNAGPIDRALVREWMRLDWQSTFPGVVLAPVRDSLLRHLDALLAEPLPQISLDGELVAQARSTFAAVPMAKRIYSRIRPSAAAQRIAPWRPSDALGAAGAGLFVRASGKRLNDGIPGFFTVDGFHTVLLPSLASAARDVASESWVLGQRVDLDTNGPQMRSLERDVIAAVESDYAQTWDAMLADLNVVQQRSLSQAAQDLYILASPQSPMRSMLVSIARQLNLSVPPAHEQSATRGQASAASPGRDGIVARLQSGPGERTVGHNGNSAARSCDRRTLQGADRSGGRRTGRADRCGIRSLSDMQQQLAKMAATLVSSGTAAVPPGIDPALALRAEALAQPQPLARWLTAIASAGSALRSGSPRQQLAAAFNASGGPAELCALVVSGRYPFVAAASQDASLADFSRLFAPGGLFDGFVNTLLRPYVDTSGRTWRLLSSDNAAAPVPPGDLAQFQRAASIRDAFFADGGSVVSLRLVIAPVSLDVGARQVEMELDGTTVSYSRGPTRSTQITWPGRSQAQTARLVFDPPPTGRAGVIQEIGPLVDVPADGARAAAAVSVTGPLHADIPDRRAASSLRATREVCDQSIRTGAAAGVPLSGGAMSVSRWFSPPVITLAS